MKLLKIICKLLFVILIALLYFIISILLNYKNYVVFVIITDLVLSGFIITQLIKLSRKKGKVIIIFICLVIFYSKISIDYRSLPVLKQYSLNSSMYELLKPQVLANMEIKEYEKVFKTKKKGDITIYYKNDLEPALELIYAYLDKAKGDNLKLFGDVKTEPLTIKFDYDKDIFKKRDINSKDYAGLYVNGNRAIYVYVEDCYKNALALNLESSYIRQTLLHEYNHYILYQFINSNNIPEDKIPIWFIEGVAEYAGYEGLPGGAPVKMLAFNQLNTNNEWTDYRNKGYSVYEQSHYAVRELTILKGEKVIKTILLKTKDMDFNTAFKQAAAMSLEDYEKILNSDFKNGWKKYRKMNPSFEMEMFADVKMTCIEKYIKMNPDNIDAMLDLAHLYEISGAFDKSKSTLEMAINKEPENEMAWFRLALLYVDSNDFDNAVKTFEKLVSINPKSSAQYINLAQVLLLTDVNEAVSAIEMASKLDKSNYVKKQTKTIIDYRNSLKNGKPFEACLELIKSDIIYPKNIEKALIDKLEKEFPDIKNSSRSQLVKIKAKLNVE